MFAFFMVESIIFYLLWLVKISAVIETTMPVQNHYFTPVDIQKPIRNQSNEFDLKPLYLFLNKQVAEHRSKYKIFQLILICDNVLNMGTFLYKHSVFHLKDVVPFSSLRSIEYLS